MTQWFICFCVCVCIQCDSSRHADICELSWSLCVSKKGHMNCHNYTICLIFTVVLCFVFIVLSQFFFLINTSPTCGKEAAKVRDGIWMCWRWNRARFMWILLVWPPPYIHAFVIHLHSAYRLLYYSWNPYCFYTMQNTCFFLLYYSMPFYFQALSTTKRGDQQNYCKLLHK